MKIKKNLLLSVVLFIVWGLASCQTNKDDPVFAALSSYRRLTFNSIELSCSSIGSQNESDKINVLIIGYTTNQALCIETARKLYVNLIMALLDQINNNPIIIANKDSFITFPLTIENFRVNIKSNVHGRNNVSVMKIINGKLYYRWYDDKLKQYEDLYEETFEKALQKVKEEELQESSIDKN